MFSSYDLVRGPSGNGLMVGYFPEITSVPNTVDAVIGYDQLHVNAWLAWLDATTPKSSEGRLTAIPKLWGGNFQCVNVAQKTVGYSNSTGNSFSPALLKAMDFVDTSLGAVVSKLKKKGILDETLIVVASKHGQAPIDPKLYQKLDPATITNLTGVPVAWQTSDDIALIFLNKSSDTTTAANNLKVGAVKGKITSIIYGSNLTSSGYGDPLADPSVPDIIVQPNLGVVYTTSKAKIAEHGGISSDDRLVATFVSNPKLRKMKYSQRVYTTQVGPTILQGLGLDPKELQGARIEGTKILPGFS
jgi:Type I phosphodiesterase / nucleotide pyrophosphatase